MPTYDAIVVGARCAGSPTAMLLARTGHRVLLIDRARFPSDTFRAHFVRVPAVRYLRQWGLLDRVLASGCPPVRKRTTDLGDFRLTGYPPGFGDVPGDLAPRRFVLDAILVEAAVAAGAEVREGFTVEDLVFDGDSVVGVRGRAGGNVVEERARMVVGADGQYSLVARRVGADTRCATPPLTFAYYSYWADVPVEGIEVVHRPAAGCAFITFPTNNGLSVVAVQARMAQFPAWRHDLEGHFFAALRLAPDLHDRVRLGRRVDRWRGSGDLPNFIRAARGPGWALVGDAGYHRDPLPAQGISDAFRDAQAAAEAIHAGLTASQSIESAMSDFEARRDAAALAGYEATVRACALSAPPPELLRLRAALRGNQADTNRFYGVEFGTVPRQEFYAPENIVRILCANVAQPY
ncbi:MAG: FAD-dependent monooxygenase [Chloroflexi bacterium]|nr:FAD-dependent monooxygenase [Chloroflexota bacterium]